MASILFIDAWPGWDDTLRIILEDHTIDVYSELEKDAEPELNGYDLIIIGCGRTTYTTDRWLDFGSRIKSQGDNVIALSESWKIPDFPYLSKGEFEDGVKFKNMVDEALATR